MSMLKNIAITQLEDGMISLLIDEQPISSKYGVKFDASMLNDLRDLEIGQLIKLFDQFIFSHTDLNFEHQYKYVTAILHEEQGYRLVKNFVYAIKIEGQPEIEHVITKQGQAMTTEDVKEFIQTHIQKSLTDYTDLNYAY